MAGYIEIVEETQEADGLKSLSILIVKVIWLLESISDTQQLGDPNIYLSYISTLERKRFKGCVLPSSKD